jgi:hypothetical protein
MNPDQFSHYACEIEDAFAQLSSESMPNSGDTAWTQKIKEVIGDIGIHHDYVVCASGFPEKFDGEWLFDLIWYKNNENGRLDNVPLVMESEWLKSYSDIRFDFEKLLVANSPIKVMVFQNRGDTFNEIFDKLAMGIKEYAFKTPAIYILACYQLNIDEFVVRKIEIN